MQDGIWDCARVLDHGLHAMVLPGNARLASAKVGSHHYVRIEQGDESLEIPSTRRREECVNHFALTCEIGVGGGYIGALHATSRPAGELPGRRGRSTDHRGD